MKCWKYHGVFPHWRGSLPPVLGNPTNVCYCDAGAAHHSLRSRGSPAMLAGRTPILKPNCLYHCTFWVLLLSLNTAVTPWAPRSHGLPKSRSVLRGCPGWQQQPHSGTNVPAWCIVHGEAGAGLWLSTTFLPAFNLATQVIFRLPSSMICLWLNDPQARGVSYPRGLYPVGQKPCTGKCIAHFHRERV